MFCKLLYYICHLIGRTIQGKEEDALKVIGKTAFSGLEQVIFGLMGHQNFKNAATRKYSNLVHNDTVQKISALKTYELEKTIVPPFRAKTYKELIGRSPGGYELDYDSENEGERPNPSRKWAMSGGKEDEDEIDREVREKMADMNIRWLEREDKYVKPAEKLGMERDILEERRILLLTAERKRLGKLTGPPKLSSSKKHRRSKA